MRPWLTWDFFSATEEEHHAARKIQDEERARQRIFKSLSRQILCSVGGKPAPNGRVLFQPDGDQMVPARPYVAISEKTTVPLLVNYIFRHWRLPKPEIIITVRHLLRLQTPWHPS
jgi:hypothetical protein